MITSALLSSALAYVLWGFAHNLPLVFVFVVVFGGIVGPPLIILLLVSHASHRAGASVRSGSQQQWRSTVRSYSKSAGCSRSSKRSAGSQPFSPFSFFAIARGFSVVFGPFIAASLHPVRVSMIAEDHLGPGAGGWAGYGFTCERFFFFESVLKKLSSVVGGGLTERLLGCTQR